MLKLCLGRAGLFDVSEKWTRGIKKLSGWWWKWADLERLSRTPSCRCIILTEHRQIGNFSKDSLFSLAAYLSCTKATQILTTL